MCIEGNRRIRALCLLLLVPVVSAGIACLANPCYHGICIDDVNSTYSCYCIDGYTGVQCQTNWDECWSSPCQNGGTCIDGVAAYNCSCPDGFIGDNCETNYNECESNPCMNNGTCIDMTNEYVCHCLPGFAGEHCEVDVAVCNSTDEVRCYNGGECIEGPGFKFYCKCLPGWAGPKCEEQIDECESNPCQNGGVCIDVHADYMCACSYGFTGKSCEIQIEFCDNNSCSNDALCVVEDGIRICYCVPDYHGERCELQYDECLLGPRCMNGGTCIDGVDNFTCSCPPKLTGALCECLIMENGSFDCEYIRPSPYPEATLPTLLTTLHEDGMVNVTTVESIGHYDTTTTENILSTITEESTSTKLTTDLSTITAISSDKDIIETTTESMTTKIDIITEESQITTDIVTTETYIKETSTPSKPEITTECTESCSMYNVSTIKLPPAMDLETTTQLIKFETTSSISIEPTETSLTTTDSNDILTKSTIKGEIDTSTSSTEAITPAIITETTAKEITTLKVDTSTEKMFTDTPTDHTLEISATTAYSVGTSTELTIPEVTTFDTTTILYTTIQSECSDTVCNNHGVCTNGPHGIRCHCNFNYGGKFCEDKISVTSAAFGGNSYITHTLNNSTSIDIEFNAKTLITDGQIMHVDIEEGVYMQLFINMGLLKFKFSCGYQTMLLSELKTYVNKGYPMKIETRLDLYLKDQHCNATLRLNDTVAMSGGQIANISSLDHNTTIYFGNTPSSNNSDNKPFIGCIRDLKVNGDSRQMFGEALDAVGVTECSSLSCLSGPCLNGGSCSDSGEGYICACANGWMGEHCNESVCEHNPCQSGGSCVRHPGSGFLCLCPYGKHGIFCEYNVDITRPSLAPISSGISSYVVYPLSSMAMSSDRFDLRLRFQTADMDQIALLAFVGQNGPHDSRSQHFALTFVKGYIMLTWNMGGGPRRIFTARALSVRRGGHAVRVWRRGRSAGLSLDSRHNVSGNAPAHHAKMQLLPYIYIGGHPSRDFRDLPHDLPLHSGWRGCIWEVGGQAVGGGKAVGGRGVGQCGVAQCTAKSCNAPRGVCIHSPATYGCICNEGWFGATCANTSSPCDRSRCQGSCVLTTEHGNCDCPYGRVGEYCEQDLFPIDILFTGIRSYLQLKARSISSVSLSLEVEIKPTKERGLVIYVQTPHFYTALSLQGGLLEYRWTDRLSGLTSLVRSGVVLSLSQWHSVKAGRYGTRLYVWVDGTLSTEPMLAHAYPHTASEASIMLGGANDLAELPFDVMSGPPESYTGCLKHLQVNNILLPLEQQNIAEGRNVAACEGAGCGGGRCRRTTCSPARCAPPARCRRHACRCGPGRAGDYCQLRINVTVPQFDGDALLSLGRRGEGQRLADQRLASAPAYIALNFTTSEPDGLMLWLSMDTDYLGVGLENGYLKIVWSLHCNASKEILNNEIPSATRVLSRLVPHAGFMADGDWHMLVLRLKMENITVSIDEMLVYVDEPCLASSPAYEDVDLNIGGVTEENSAISSKIFPQNFKGCIDRISTKEHIYLTNYTEVYSENVKSCQLFPAP